MNYYLEFQIIADGDFIKPNYSASTRNISWLIPANLHDPEKFAEPNTITSCGVKNNKVIGITRILFIWNGEELCKKRMIQDN